MVVLEIIFWLAVGLLVYTHLGYPLVLWALSRARQTPEAVEPTQLPRVSMIVAAHNEEGSILDWVRSTLASDYPRESLEVVVVSDGSTDRTLEWAIKAGADVVVDLPRGGKVTALNAGVERATGEILAFSDANSTWDPSALRRLVSRLAEPDVGYVCGHVAFTATEGASNQEGLYWRYEMAVRAMESELGGITAGNGAINAVRRHAYVALGADRGQDISFPFELAKRGWRSVYEPLARASEPMAPTIEGEFLRKRRMMTGAWNTLLHTSLLSPRGYKPLFALQIYSHRLLRYMTPILHLAALVTNAFLLGEGTLYIVTMAAQVALLAAALLARVVPLRPLLVARYYVAVTAASAAGLWDLMRHGVPRTWESVEGTR